MSESLKKKKKEFGLRALFLFFNSKMEHPHVKCSLLLLIVLVTSKLGPTKLFSGQIKIKINLIVVTYHFLKKMISIQIGFYANTSQTTI